MSYEIVLLDRFDGEFKKLIKKLNKSTQAKILREIDLLEEFGKDLGMPYSKKIDNLLWELRSSGKERIRIFYSIKDKKIYLLSCFLKKSQKSPKKELGKAKERLKNIYHV